MRDKTTKFVIVILLVPLTTGTIFVPQKAYAVACGTSILGVEVQKCVATNPPHLSFLSLDWIKEWILKPVIRIIIRAILQATTQQIVSWIQGGNGKNVGYVKNLEQAARREADAAGGEFLNKLTGLNLCGNIGAFLNITLRTPGLQQRLECTVTDIVRNVNSFYRDFERGGWPAFIKVSLEPNNNPYGAYLIALEAKVQAENRARERIERGVSPSQPFLGFRVPVKRNCQSPAQKNFSQDPSQGRDLLQSQPKNAFVRSLGSLQFASPLLAQLPPIGTDFGPPAPPQPIIEGIPQDAAERARIEAEQRSRDDFGDGNEGIRQEEIRRQEAIRRAEQEEGGGIGSEQDESIQDYSSYEQALGQSETEAIRGIQQPICDTEYETKTPGALITEGLNKVAFNGIDFANTAKDFDEAIAVIINALINKLISTTFGGADEDSSGQGIFDPGFRTLPKEDLTESIIGKRINDGLFMIDATLAVADTKLLSERKAWFDTKKKIDELTLQNTPEALAEIQQLKQKVSELQISIASALEVKKSILYSQTDLVIMKRSLGLNPSPSEITRIAQDLPAVLLRLGYLAGKLGGAPSPSVSTGSNKRDLLELLRGTKNNLTSALAMIDDTGKEIERVLAGTNIDQAKRQALTLYRTALLTQRTVVRSPLDSVIEIEKTAAQTSNETRIRDITNDLMRQLLTINQIIDQTDDLFTLKIDASLK